jgi:hypothetical protein
VTGQEKSSKQPADSVGAADDRTEGEPMHRDGLFFDPLEDDESPQTDPAPGAPNRHRAPDPEELKVQRQRELNRVQEELQLMAQGIPLATASPRRRRRAPEKNR